ncbi:MAG: ATP-binding cassette domain-containing protein [Sphaerochaetaceae bacterium]|nr:ATP-binding cassette domain-containing protein [Sphaerochaetaceae bacterium]
MKAFEIKNISYSYPSYPQKKILDKLSVDINEGSFVCITGSVGCGKSTLSLLLNGLLKAQEGTVSVFGCTDEREMKKLVQLVFQDPDNSFISETVERDVAFGPENLCLEQKEIRERVDLALKTLGIEGLSKRRITTLSGGQKQLVSLAGALAVRPKALVLDEALSMLDEKTHERVLSVLNKLCKEEGLTVVLITHRASEIKTAGEVYLMKEGKCSKM